MRKDAQLNRTRLIDAARECFRLRGADASLDEIAERAGVGRSTLFRNFPDRLQLIRAVSALEMDIVSRQAEQEKLYEAADGIFQLMRHLARLSAVYRAFNLAVAEDGTGVGMIAEATQQAVELVTPSIERAKREGLLKDAVTPHTILMACDMMGAIFGTAFGLSETESMERGLQMLMEGLAP